MTLNYTFSRLDDLGEIALEVGDMGKNLLSERKVLLVDTRFVVCRPDYVYIYSSFGYYSFLNFADSMPGLALIELSYAFALLDFKLA